MTTEEAREVAERVLGVLRRLREAHPHTDSKPLPVEQRVSGWCVPEELHFLRAEAQTAREAYSDYLWEQNPGMIPLSSLEGDDS